MSAWQAFSPGVRLALVGPVPGRQAHRLAPGWEVAHRSDVPGPAAADGSGYVPGVLAHAEEGVGTTCWIVGERSVVESASR